MTLAFFVTPHGFGHATRAAAVMAAIERRCSAARFEIFTSAPAWLFAETLVRPFGHHELTTDVGLVQRTPLHEDLPATLAALDALYPLRPAVVADLARRLKHLACRLVVCDIAPLGIAAAHAAGLPAVLQENFTWDWIYAAYLDEAPELARHAEHLRALFAEADLHVQTAPACAPAPVDLVSAPVSRAPRVARGTLRARLDLDDDQPMVLVSMKGLSPESPALRRAGERPDVRFLVPSHQPAVLRHGNLILVPWGDAFFHPDLITASDAVISKLGYSTLAEVWRAGVPFGYVLRSRFPENGPMQAFAEDQALGLPLPTAAFESGDWIDALPSLLDRPRRPAQTERDGADEIAEFLLARFA